MKNTIKKLLHECKGITQAEISELEDALITCMNEQIMYDKYINIQGIKIA